MAILERLTTRINIEMTGDTKRYLVSAKQGDKATRYVIAKLLNDGKAYTIPTGARVVFNVEKPDGKHVYNTCTYSGSEVTVELTNQTLAAVGTAFCDIEVRTSDNTQLITTASFTIEIEKSMRNDDAILSANEFTELEDRIAGHIKNINDTEAAVKTAEAARVTAENGRVTAENGRVAAENIRNQNENTRIQQENLREQNNNQAIKNIEQAIKNANETAKNIQESADSGEFSSSIEIGEVITGKPGTKASVTNRGTNKDAILDIAIPKGDTGTIENLETATLGFEEQTERENISSNDTISVLFGKIKKWFNDLKKVAFTGKYSDLSGTPTDMRGATVNTAGESGLVPAPTVEEHEKYLRGDGTWTGLANNLLTNVEGYALDATQGKKLKEEQDTLKEEFTELNSKIFRGSEITDGADLNNFINERWYSTADTKIVKTLKNLPIADAYEIAVLWIQFGITPSWGMQIAFSGHGNAFWIHVRMRDSLTWSAWTLIGSNA